MKYLLLTLPLWLVACGQRAATPPAATSLADAAADAAMADAALTDAQAADLGPTDSQDADAAAPADTLTDATVPPDIVSQVDVSAVPLEGFDAPELLGRPTATSVSVSLLPAVDIELYVEAGLAGQAMTVQTPPQTGAAHKPLVVLVQGLQADSEYGYRVRWRATGSTAPFAEGPLRRLHTQRKPGQPFRFTVQSDSHLDENTVLAQYHRTLANILADMPDFHMDLGDTFMCEKHPAAFTATVQAAPDAATVDKRYLYERDHFGRVAHSVPLFLVNGNHEGEFGYLFSGTGNDLATWVTQARKAFYLNPTPDSFYSGDALAHPVVGQRAAWYAWQWGDALMIALDPYWNTTKKSKDAWDLTLGKAQYDWLAKTLAESTAKWKFVFLHNLVGGLDGAMRGGVEAAPFFEWGGANADGTPGFAQKRPGWQKPIHPLLVEHKVTAVFHGHDHLYVHQQLDGVVYQEVPQPSAKNTQNGAQLAKAYHYDSGTAIGSAGHLRITVSPTQVTGEYVRAWLPAAEKGAQKNGEIAHSWTIGAK